MGQVEPSLFGDRVNQIQWDREEDEPLPDAETPRAPRRDRIQTQPWMGGAA